MYFINQTGGEKPIRNSKYTLISQNSTLIAQNSTFGNFIFWVRFADCGLFFPSFFRLIEIDVFHTIYLTILLTFVGVIR